MPQQQIDLYKCQNDEGGITTAQAVRIRNVLGITGIMGTDIAPGVFGDNLAEQICTLNTCITGDLDTCDNNLCNCINAHINGISDVHDASAVSITSAIYGSDVNVQSALEYICDHLEEACDCIANVGDGIANIAFSYCDNSVSTQPTISNSNLRLHPNYDSGCVIIQSCYCVCTPTNYFQFSPNNTLTVVPTTSTFTINNCSVHICRSSDTNGVLITSGANSTVQACCFTGCARCAGCAVAINDNVVTASKISTDAVTASKICTGAVTESKINDGAVTTSKIGTDAVTASKICTGAVTESKICAGAVTNVKIADSAINAAKLCNTTNIYVCSTTCTSSATSTEYRIAVPNHNQYPRFITDRINQVSTANITDNSGDNITWLARICNSTTSSVHEVARLNLNDENDMSYVTLSFGVPKSWDYCIVQVAHSSDSTNDQYCHVVTEVPFIG